MIILPPEPKKTDPLGVTLALAAAIVVGALMVSVIATPALDCPAMSIVVDTRTS